MTRKLPPFVLASIAALLLGRLAAADGLPLEADARARAFAPGELVVVTVSMDGEADALDVTWSGGHASGFRVGPRTWSALVGIDVECAPGTYPVLVEARSSSERASSTLTWRIEPRRFPTRRLTVDPSFVSPPASVRARIADEAAQVATIYAHPEPERLWTGAFRRPVPGPANSRFGTRSVYNGEMRRPHGGTDFLSPAGTPVMAPGEGRVVLARDLYFTGNTVIIDHGLGMFSLLAHLSRLDVDEGQHVGSGQQVGSVGATGRVTGPHLHWGVRVGQARVDPLSLLALLGPGAPGEPPPAR